MSKVQFQLFAPYGSVRHADLVSKVGSAPKTPANAPGGKRAVNVTRRNATHG